MTTSLEKVLAKRIQVQHISGSAQIVEWILGTKFVRSYVLLHVILFGL